MSSSKSGSSKYKERNTPLKMFIVKTPWKDTLTIRDCDGALY